MTIITKDGEYAVCMIGPDKMMIAKLKGDPTIKMDIGKYYECLEVSYRLNSPLHIYLEDRVVYTSIAYACIGIIRDISVRS